jgi:hypothetical protein
MDEEAEEGVNDSTPLDFATFVPTHDPSLAMPSGPSAPSLGATPSSFWPPFMGNNTPRVSRDQALQHWMSSMYWAGFYAAAFYVSIVLYPYFAIDRAHHKDSIKTESLSSKWPMGMRIKTRTRRHKLRKKLTEEMTRALFRPSGRVRSYFLLISGDIDLSY